MRPGYQSVIPYLILSGGARSFVEFTKQVFRATERMIVPASDGTVVHGELIIGDSVIEFADASDQFPPRPAPLHHYVRDVDEVFARGLAAGATSLYAVTDQDYGDREGGLKDPFGNIWFVATHKGAGYRPDGLHDVTPYLHVDGADRLMTFLQQAFGAEATECFRDPDRVAHARMRIGDSCIEFSDAHAQWKPFPVSIQLYVDSADAIWERSLKAGATGEFPPATKPYGDRMAGVRDFAGNQWFLSEYVGGESEVSSGAQQ